MCDPEVGTVSEKASYVQTHPLWQNQTSSDAVLCLATMDAVRGDRLVRGARPAWEGPSVVGLAS